MKKFPLLLIAALLVLIAVVPALAAPLDLVSVTGNIVWADDTPDQRSPVWLALARRVPDNLDPLGYRLTLVEPRQIQAIPLAQNTFTHVFENLPKLDNNQPIDYTVVEIKDPVASGNRNFIAPPGYLRSSTKSTDAQGYVTVTITNTRQAELPPLKNGDNSTPCQIDWYNQIAMDRTLWHIASDYDYNRYKVSGVFPWSGEEYREVHSPGVMVTQAVMEGNSIIWRVVLGSDHELHNGLITIDFSKLIDQGMIPRLAPDPLTGEVALDFRYGVTYRDWKEWLNTSAGLDSAYHNRFTPINPQGTTTFINEVLELSIPQLPAQSAIIFEVITDFKPTQAQPALSTDYYGTRFNGAILDGTRYYMDTHFTADTRCVHVEKTWQGSPGSGDTATLALTIDGENIAKKAKDLLPTLVGASFTDRFEMSEWLRGVDAQLPGFFYTLAGELTFHEWIDLQGQPTGKTYAFTQAEAERTLAAFLPLYEVTLGAAPDNTHTFAQLDWLTPDRYSLVETALSDGWQQMGEISRSTNEHRLLLGITNRQYKVITATKTWANLDQAEANRFLQLYAGQSELLDPYLDVWFQLYSSVGGSEPTAVSGQPILRVSFPTQTDGSAAAPPYHQSVIWPAMPMTDEAGNPIAYAVREVWPNGRPLTLGQFTKVEDGLNVTNTHFPVKDGVMQDDPCQFEWYAEAIADNTSKDWTNQNWTYKVNHYHFPAHKGQMEIQHYGALTWRIPISTDYAMENTRLVIHMKDAMALGWVPKITVDAQGRVTDGIVFESQFWHDQYNHNGLNGINAKIIDKTGTPAIYNSADQTITLTTGSLPANGGFLLYIQGTAPTAAPGVRYPLGATFTGEYNCLKTVKAWHGGTSPRPAITLNLLLNGVPVTQDSVLEALYQAAGSTPGTDLVFPIIKRDSVHNQALVLPGTVYAWVQELMLKYPQLSPLIQSELAALWRNANDNALWEPGAPVSDYYPGQTRPIPTFTTTFTLESTFLETLAQQISEHYTVTLADGQTEHTWANLSYQDAQGNPLVYTIEEAPIAGYRSTTQVEDLEDNTRARLKRLITLTNTYLPPERVVLSISAVKRLEGATLTANQFSFSLEGGGISLSAANDATGHILFPDFALEKEGEYTFTLKETTGTDDTISYDDSLYTARVKVTLNEVENRLTHSLQWLKNGAPYAEESPVFTNAYIKPTPTPTPAPTPRPTPAPGYDPVYVTLSGQKQAVNHRLEAGAYQFVIRDGSGKALETVTHDAAGAFSFSPRGFSRTGTFLYTIQEVQGDKTGIQYDSTVYTAKITLSVQGGALTARVDWLKNGTPYAGDIRFVNQAAAPATGDNHLTLPLALMALALIALTGAAYISRKRHAPRPSTGKNPCR